MKYGPEILAHIISFYAIASRWWRRREYLFLDLTVAFGNPSDEETDAVLLAPASLVRAELNPAVSRPHPFDHMKTAVT